MEALKFKVRKARLEDLSQVAQLERRVWKELALSYAELRRRFLLFPQGFWVAALRPEIAGFCSALLFDGDAREGELDETFPSRHVPRGKTLVILGLTVNPIFRRRRIGSTLVERELEVARKLGCLRVQLIANDFSRPLFEKLGFRTDRELPHLFAAHPHLMPSPVLMQHLGTASKRPVY